MAQEDKGLIFRGLLLLTLIGALVTVVLGIILWRHQPADTASAQILPESLVTLVVPQGIGSYPANVSWLGIQQMADTMPSAPGWEIRYNAAASLARRGSDSVPWPIISEMLDENAQKRNCMTRSADGKVSYDEAAARAYVITGLRVLTNWHEQQKGAGKSHVSSELRKIYAQVERLTQSPFVEIQVQATKATNSFFSN